jgi:hypothetical protein
VIRVHQARNWGDNSMPIRIRIVSESNLIFVFQPNQPCHGIRTGTIHADLAIMVHCHKRKSRVDLRVDDLDFQSVNRIDRFPIRPCSSAQRINRQLEFGSTNGVYIHNILEIADVRENEVFLVRGCRLHGTTEDNAPYIFIPGSQ